MLTYQCLDGCEGGCAQRVELDAVRVELCGGSRARGFGATCVRRPDARPAPVDFRRPAAAPPHNLTAPCRRGVMPMLFEAISGARYARNEGR